MPRCLLNPQVPKTQKEEVDVYCVILASCLKIKMYTRRQDTFHPAIRSVECTSNSAYTSTGCVRREAVNSSWSANQGDSASSSDETSSANGDSLFSMFSGPDLVAAVKQRRLVPNSSTGSDLSCRTLWVLMRPNVNLFFFLFFFCRKHSCGEPEVCTLPSPPLHHLGDDNQVKYEPLITQNAVQEASLCR